MQKARKKSSWDGACVSRPRLEAVWKKRTWSAVLYPAREESLRITAG